MSRRAAWLPAALAAVLLASGCRAVKPAPVRHPTARTVDTAMDWRFARFDPVEIAVRAPTGDSRRPLLDGLREGLYRELLDRGYSPLAPEYVDALDPGTAGTAGPCVLESEVTASRRTTDGGLMLSGRASLIAPTAEGGQMLYLLSLADYYVPPVPGTEEKHGAIEAGRRLGAALLVRLPRR